jgi:DsbC/DsbD-like thiol-disulfide interchange protein
MIRHVIAITGTLCVSSAAGDPSHATAELLFASTTYQAGQPQQAALRLTMDSGWHTYWINPGEGGMRLSVEWLLPTGWKADEPAYPLPIRIRTGDLSAFGYEGTVLFPITITPPPISAGVLPEPAQLKAEVTWLACDDHACIPENATLTHTLQAGEPVPTPEAAVIHAALEKIPRPGMEGIHLEVVEKTESLELTVSTATGRNLDLEGCEGFPVTPQTTDPAAAIRFSRQESSWRAEVRKSEYAISPLKHFTLVLGRKPPAVPVQLIWNSP